MVFSIFRSKHQKLIIRCFPFSRTAENIPNPSELSYLCYYAKSRPAKLPKVSAFLQRIILKSIHYNSRHGQVIVSLAIFEALIINCPQDLNTFVETYLKCLLRILQKRNADLQQATLQSFNTFTRTCDGSILVMDNGVRDIYLKILNVYFTIATAKYVPCYNEYCPKKPTLSDILSYRKIGAEAFNEITKSKYFQQANQIYAKVQIQYLVMAALHCIWIVTVEQNGLDQAVEIERPPAQGIVSKLASRLLLVRQQYFDSVEPKQSQSIYSVPRTLPDEEIETGDQEIQLEEAGKLALDTIYNIFQSQRPSYITEATDIIVHYMLNMASLRDLNMNSIIKDKCVWAKSFIAVVADWTGVQYTHEILRVCIKFLEMRPERCRIANGNTNLNPKVEQDIPKSPRFPANILIPNLIRALLSSDISMIGVSAVEITNKLLNFVHTEKADGPFRDMSNLDWLTILRGCTSHEEIDIDLEPFRLVFLCIQALAQHSFYPDQNYDSCENILTRLSLKSSNGNENKPERESLISDTIFALEATKVIFCAKLSSRPTTLLCTENGNRSRSAGSLETTASHRQAVPFHVWKAAFVGLGTQSDPLLRYQYFSTFWIYLSHECEVGQLSLKDISIPNEITLTEFYNAIFQLFKSGIMQQPWYSDLHIIRLSLDKMSKVTQDLHAIKGIAMLYNLGSEFEDSKKYSKIEVDSFNWLMQTSLKSVATRFDCDELLSKLQKHIPKIECRFEPMEHLDYDIDQYPSRSEFINCLINHSAFPKRLHDYLKLPYDLTNSVYGMAFSPAKKSSMPIIGANRTSLTSYPSRRPSKRRYVSEFVRMAENGKESDKRSLFFSASNNNLRVEALKSALVKFQTEHSGDLTLSMVPTGSTVSSLSKNFSSDVDAELEQLAPVRVSRPITASELKSVFDSLELHPSEAQAMVAPSV